MDTNSLEFKKELQTTKMKHLKIILIAIFIILLTIFIFSLRIYGSSGCKYLGFIYGENKFKKILQLTSFKCYIPHVPELPAGFFPDIKS